MKISTGKLLAGTAAVALTLGFGGGTAHAAADVSTAFVDGVVNKLNDESGELVMKSTGGAITFGGGASGGTTGLGKPSAGDIVLGVLYLNQDQQSAKFFDGSTINNLSGIFAFQVKYSGATQLLLPYSISAAVTLAGKTWVAPVGYVPPVTGSGVGDYGALFQNTTAKTPGSATPLTLQNYIDDNGTGSLVAIASLDTNGGGTQNLQVTGSGTTTTFASYSDITSFDPSLKFGTGDIFPGLFTCAVGSITPASFGNLCLTGTTSSASGTVNAADFTVDDNTVFSVFPVKIPEPASLAILGSGLVGFGWLNRRRARKNARREMAS